ncbi:MAG: metallophosphoesterase [candidate division KSB1 bacterium]|nr:metallophosphoesterase [candidate division KSB1 bacterium]MDZ7272725.1 metallophosphoesterase [candidate division KSB1 bacterium]MDZ7284250.1 metallophosphoesterase [candidate division KSB1 bacterium]MDZ7297351.1 metallophosphoesterase [candidate division KSB1 bacterium]MDZ7307060.1 metallophosphoesterase [candidate division KSB1 bacterium]
MRDYFPMMVSAVFLLLASLGNYWGTRLGPPAWRQQRVVRSFLKFMPAGGLLCALLWAAGTALEQTAVMEVGAAGTALASLFAATLLLVWPPAIASDRLARWRKARGGQSAAPTTAVDAGRRRFLLSTAAAVPALLMAAGAGGLAQAFGEIRLPAIRLKFKRLPAGLHGLKIMHFSDFHLGYYLQLDEVERLLTRVAGLTPDLILVTGDLADRLPLLPDLLRLLAALQPPLGVWASLGNHEYYRGIKTVRRCFAAGPVPLLCNEGVCLQHHGAELYLGGADDPQRLLRRDLPHFLETTVAAAMANAPAAAFKILMSHRPAGFLPAAARGVDLTLAGHTHGAQIGMNGRSLFEGWAPESFLWGHYRRAESQLYTSSGAGHWFPVRLGCPPEAPLIVLLPENEEARPTPSRKG